MLSSFRVLGYAKSGADICMNTLLSHTHTHTHNASLTPFVEFSFYFTSSLASPGVSIAFQ